MFGFSKRKDEQEIKEAAASAIDTRLRDIEDARAADAELAKERRRIKNLIRKGKLPRYMFARGRDGKLERQKKWVTLETGAKIQVDAGLTFRQVSTLHMICGKPDPLR